LLDVVRAASAEIADYARIDATAMPDVSIAGQAVGDLVHLLAELMENAATYSPPHAKVLVAARHSVDGFHLAVYDEGIGLTAAQLSQINARLSRPTALTSALAGTMGLLVVARLAARHSIVVELRSNHGAGTAALVTLPHSLVRQSDGQPGTPRRNGAQGTAGTSLGPTHPYLSGAAHRQSTQVHPDHGPWGLARTQHDLSSAWFTGGDGLRQPGVPGGRIAPGDAERARVTELTLSTIAHGDTIMPRRKRGANLHPGAVGGERHRQATDPDRIRTQLAGLSRGIAAAQARTEHLDDHNGRRQ
jgi:hypothetical protein